MTICSEHIIMNELFYRVQRNYDVNDFGEEFHIVRRI